jgi:hypothetical protein
MGWMTINHIQSFGHGTYVDGLHYPVSPRLGLHPQLSVATAHDILCVYFNPTFLEHTTAI